MTQHVKKGAEFAPLSSEILVIEDEPLVQALLLRYLSNFPQSPHFAQLQGPPPTFRIESRESGWDLLQTDLSAVKVAVVDVLLPQVTGVDLVRDFRRRYPDMGIVPISGMATEPMKRSLRETMPQELAGLIAKPLRKEEFYAAFARAWNFAQVLHPVQPPSPRDVAAEGDGPLWSTVSVSTPTAVPMIERRGLKRHKASA